MGFILTGYQHACRRNVGGVSLIGFVPVQNIASVIEEGGLVSDIQFKENENRFVEYQTQVDNAELKISTSEVSIQLRFNALSSKSSVAYNELLEASACGLVALVQMNNGAVALLGWTTEFKGRRPLMNIEAEGTSGKAPTDDNYLDITLKSSQVTAPLYLSDAYAKDVDTLFEQAKENQ